MEKVAKQGLMGAGLTHLGQSAPREACDMSRHLQKLTYLLSQCVLLWLLKMRIQSSYCKLPYTIWHSNSNQLWDSNILLTHIICTAPVTIHNPSGCPMHVSTSSFQIHITYPSRCPQHSWIQRWGCIQTPGSSLCTILVSGSSRILEKNCFMNCDFNQAIFYCLVMTFLRTLGHTWETPLSL